VLITYDTYGILAIDPKNTQTIYAGTDDEVFKYVSKFEKEVKQIIILQVGNSSFTVNGETRILDSPPIIKNNRTLLPIRAIIEAPYGTVG